MSQLQPHEALSIATSLFAGLFMLHLSLRKKALRWRLPGRCPSCGRLRRQTVCDNCG